MNSKDTVTTEVFPLIWTQDVVALSDWAVAVLGLTESCVRRQTNGTDIALV